MGETKHVHDWGYAPGCGIEAWGCSAGSCPNCAHTGCACGEGRCEAHRELTAPSAGPVAARFPPQAGDVWRFNGAGKDHEFTGRRLEPGVVSCSYPIYEIAASPGAGFQDKAFRDGTLTFVRYGTPPAVEAPRVVVAHLDADSVPGTDGDPVTIWPDQSGNGHHLVAPRPTPTRDTYASLRAKLLREENVRLCPCGEPATTHSGKCAGCSRGRPSVVSRPTIDGVLRLPAKPEPWTCEPDMDIPNA